MESAVLRNELHSYIDALPDQSLPALQPLLSFLVEPPPVMEAASEDEAAMIEEVAAEYRANPSSFTPWAKVRRALT
ncbi:hypothetical protein FACS1894147_06260 [Spirochaetia bacterium]|nr:hypothetical protein FACS1894147_06260 [Spirochaetia bacterium]